MLTNVSNKCPKLPKLFKLLDAKKNSISILNTIAYVFSVRFNTKSFFLSMLLWPICKYILHFDVLTYLPPASTPSFLPYLFLPKYLPF
jgi:hypothetical protein